MADGTPEDFAKHFRQMVSGDEPAPQGELEPEQQTEPEPETDDPAGEFVASLFAPKRGHVEITRRLHGDDAA